MRLLHPMMPFISEELYQKLPNFEGKFSSITRSTYPESFNVRFEGSSEYFKEIEEKFEIVNKFAGALRSIASGVNLPPQIKPDAFIITKEDIISQQLDLLATLGKCTKITIIEDEKTLPKGCGLSLIGNNKIFLELGSHIDANK